MESLLKSLNSAQSEAVKILDGPLLVLAGAGSGKTRVLTFRIANLIAQGKARPDQILAVTFTNKAAREMESRAQDLLMEMGAGVRERLWISTFHSICVRILRANADRLPFSGPFGIYDASDQLSMLKRVLDALNIDEKVHPAKAFQARVSAAKQLGLLPSDVENGRAPQGFKMDQLTQKVYSRYEQEMIRSSSVDFDDLLLKTHLLFRDHPDVLQAYQRKFKYILIDEYQDTNHIQYRLIHQLAKAHGNLCVVGDEDQSIYSWRGADIQNILNFEHDFPSCRIVKLEQNYRSTETIVKAASALISNNSQRKDKVLFTANNKGKPIGVCEVETEYDEARFVAQTIQELIRSEPERNYADFAVFYRTNAQSRVLEEQLRLQSIPYKIVGGLKFYDRLEIKDILAYMKLTLNVNDDVSFKRVINVPTRGIGKTTVQRLEEIANENSMGLFAAARLAVENKEFNSGACKKLAAFLNLLEQLMIASQTQSPSEIYHSILDATQYVIRLREQNTPEAESRIENLEEFDNAIVQFESERAEDVTLQSFLEEMALVSDVDSMDSEEASVTLMTLHVSKGLEFPFVFVVGMEEGLFPTGRSLNQDDPTAIEEERRLAYVGMTRARERLFLSHCRCRRMWGSENYNPPSRFLDEIPEEFVRNESTLTRPSFVRRYQNNSHATMVPPMMRATPPAFEDYSQEAPENPSHAPAVDLAKGMHVRHPTYGVGSVFESEGSGDNQKVSVVFADNTVRKFVVKYARLVRTNEW